MLRHLKALSEEGFKIDSVHFRRCLSMFCGIHRHIMTSLVKTNKNALFRIHHIQYGGLQLRILFQEG
jgi:hypothetical protein